jgi:hypothetical protein
LSVTTLKGVPPRQRTTPPLDRGAGDPATIA